MKRIRTCIILNVFAVLMCNLSESVQAEPQKTTSSQSQKTMDQQTEEKFEGKIPVSYRYLLSLPEDYSQQEKWPLLLFLHGAGERGDNLDLVKLHGPPMQIAQGKKFPCIVVSPQCPKDGWWEPVLLSALLNDIEKKYKVDQDRIYITGLSMGGYGTWALAAHTPDRFAAAIPICGGGVPYRTRFLTKMPLWVFHGAKDTAVKLGESQRMVDGLKQHGGNVKFTVYPEAGHNSWTQTYDNPDVYKWLFEQKRK